MKTVCNNYEFRRVYSRGKSFVSPCVVLYYMKNRQGVCRIGITTSKKIGNAVRRNRARRVIRAAVQSLYPQMKNGYDFILVARGRTPFVKSTDVQKSLLKLLKKAKLLKQEPEIPGKVSVQERPV